MSDRVITHFGIFLEEDRLGNRGVVFRVGAGGSWVKLYR